MKGVGSRMFPTTNRDPSCHAPLCACCYFVEPDATEIPSNMPLWYIRERDTAKWIAEAKAER